MVCCAGSGRLHSGRGSRRVAPPYITPLSPGCRVLQRPETAHPKQSKQLQYWDQYLRELSVGVTTNSTCELDLTRASLSFPGCQLFRADCSELAFQPVWPPSINLLNRIAFSPTLLLHMAYSANVNARLSVFSTGSQSSLDYFPRSATPPTSARHSSPVPPGGKAAPPRPTIYDRPLNKTRNAEVSASAFAFMFSEMIQYTQKRVSGIGELEKRLSVLGYRIGTRTLELMMWRNEAREKNPKRETRLLPVLYVVHTQLWKAVFGKTADALEKSVENDDEYMIIDNDPPITRYISIPREMNQLSCSALTAGIVEALLDGLGFPARVTAHSVPKDGFPLRTTILIKLDRSVMEREEALK